MQQVEGERSEPRLLQKLAKNNGHEYHEDNNTTH
jgi:hypothetical protein